MMQLHLAGRLVRSPERKTSKNGKDYVQALVLVTAGDTDVLVTVMAFDPDLQARLLDLQKGDSCSVCGSGSIRAYLDKEGQPAAGVSLMLNRLMALTETKAAAKAKDSSARNGQRRVEGQYSVESPAPELPPVETYADPIPF
jgi:single-stranded DNA-binding protein